MQHKLAPFRTMIHRLNSIPLPDRDYQDVLNTIKYITEANVQNRTIINKLIWTTQNKQQKKTKTNKLITLTYTDNHTEKVALKKKNTASHTELQMKQNTHCTKNTQSAKQIWLFTN